MCRYNSNSCGGLGVWLGVLLHINWHPHSRACKLDESRHIDVVQLGKTPLTREQVRQAVLDLQLVYKTHEYNPCGRNCQTFALDFCRRLRVDSDKIPLRYVNFAASPPCCQGLSGSCEVFNGNNADAKVQPLQGPHRATALLQTGDDFPESSPWRLQPRRIPQRPPKPPSNSGYFAQLALSRLLHAVLIQRGGVEQACFG